VIDLDRDVILYNVLEGLAERSEASREEALA
jgi:hypothetical protein